MKKANLPAHILKKRRAKPARRLNRKHRKIKRAVASKDKQLRRLGPVGTVYSLIAPDAFAAWSNTEEFLVFLRQLVDQSLKLNKTVAIDFRKTKKVYADATLLFWAELDRINTRKPNSVKCLRLPRDPVVRQVFSHLGILRLLGCPHVFPSTRDDVVNWQFFSGTEVDFTKGAGQALAALPHLSRVETGVLFRGASEALTNVTQHAYTSPRMDGTGVAGEGRWWMFVREEENTLTVNFCDLGLGIPFTVPQRNNSFTSLVLSILKGITAIGDHSHKEGEWIQATVEGKRSRFKEEHRGNGFGNMVETINEIGSGILRIHSNRGFYNYDLSDGVSAQKARNFKNSIYGTVVGWHIRLSKETV